MERKSKVPYVLKVEAVEDYISGKKGETRICFEMNITNVALYQWVRKYELHGNEGLKDRKNNAYYSPEFKQQAVTDYLSGKGSLIDICKKYDINSTSILFRWIKKYNSHEKFKSHNAQGEKIMTKGRTTTFEERTAIVAFCIANNDNYQLASEKFLVTYQQVYTLVKKYKEKGTDALIDRRGKRKNPEFLSETEKNAAQLKLLEAEIKRLKMENDFLKKLNEVGRRR